MTKLITYIGLASTLFASPTLHSAPSTKLMQERAVVVHLLDGKMVARPYNIPNTAIKQRVFGDWDAANHWEQTFDKQSRFLKRQRLIKQRLYPPQDDKTIRYEYDNAGGFSQYTNDKLTTQCLVAKHTTTELTYTCDVGDTKHIHYKTTDSNVTITSKTARQTTTLDNQLRQQQISIELVDSNGQPDSKSLIIKYQYPDDKTINIIAMGHPMTYTKSQTAEGTLFKTENYYLLVTDTMWD